MCLIPPVLLLRLLIRQVRLSPPFLLLLKISSSRTCPCTVRLVIFTTDLHGVVTLREYVETVAPLPTVDVMAVIVAASSVSRQIAQGEQSSSHQNQRKKQRRQKLKGLERSKHGCTRKNNMRTPCVKNLSSCDHFLCSCDFMAESSWQPVTGTAPTARFSVFFLGFFCSPRWPTAASCRGRGVTGTPGVRLPGVLSPQFIACVQRYDQTHG